MYLIKCINPKICPWRQSLSLLQYNYSIQSIQFYTGNAMASHKMGQNMCLVNTFHVIALGNPEENASLPSSILLLNGIKLKSSNKRNLHKLSWPIYCPKIGLVS